MGIEAAFVGTDHLQQDEKGDYEPHSPLEHNISDNNIENGCKVCIQMRSSWRWYAPVNTPSDETPSTA
jgi:hypothetical protein